MRIAMCAAALLLVPILVHAQDTRSYHCALDQDIRRVEIVSEPGVTVPCEVHYYKDTENPGEHQVLWSAQSEAGYCEARAEEFVEKLGDWGWVCKAGDPGVPAEESDDEMLGD